MTTRETHTTPLQISIDGGIYWPRQVFQDPREMPELRRGLLDLAAPDHFWERAEQHRAFGQMVGTFTGTSADHIIHTGHGTDIITGPVGYDTADVPAALQGAMAMTRTAMQWNRTALAQAQLIHVSDELCEVLFASHESMPLDRELHREDMPSPYGLVVFETPFQGIDSGTRYENVRVDAILWGPVRLPPRDQFVSVDGVLPGVGIAAFRWMDPRRQDDPAALAMREQLDAQDLVPSDGCWIPLGRTDWVMGDTIEQPPHQYIDVGSVVHQSMMEDRKLIAALWAIIGEKRMVERTEVRASKPARKRLARRGDTNDTSVQVIHLRRPEYRPRNEDGTTGRHVGVRFAVRPHWRNQAYGHNREKRRLILVPPHIRGPEGAPFKHAERVWSVDS